MRYLLLFLALSAGVYIASAAPLMTGFTDDASPLITYGGDWSTVEDSSAVNGAYHQADSLSDTVSISTYAPSVTVFFLYDGNGDTVEVCVNAGDCVPVNTLGATARGVIELSGLSGESEISISKQTDDATVFNFDGVYIHPSNPAATDTNTIDFEYDGETMTASLPLTITAGDAVLALLLAVLVTIQLVSFVFNVRYQAQ